MIKERLEWLNIFVECSIFKKADIAKEVGISPGTLRDLLLYGRKSISKEKFLEICSILDLNPEFFYCQEIEIPFLPFSLYKLRIKELVDLIDFFSFTKQISGLSLIYANEVYFLLFKFVEIENIFFLIAKKRAIGAQNQSFGIVSKMYNYINSISERINLKLFAGVTIGVEEFLIYKKDFINEFFEKFDFNKCEYYFQKDIVTTVKPHELELLFYLKSLGIETREQLERQIKGEKSFSNTEVV